MAGMLLTWIGLCVALLVFGIGDRRDGGALTLSYFLILSLIHVPGALGYLDTSSVLVQEEETRVGFEMTLIGMAAFITGAAVVRATFRDDTSIPERISCLLYTSPSPRDS